MSGWRQGVEASGWAGCASLLLPAFVSPAEVIKWSANDRKVAAKARSAPYYDEAPPTGPGATHRDSRKMADIELDCSIHLNYPVFFEHNDIFENSNAGKVGVYVYEPASAERHL